MIFRSRLVFTLWLAVLSSTCLSASSSAQNGDAAAVSAKINELSRAGKCAGAVALAQAQVESLERKYGPDNRDIAEHSGVALWRQAYPAFWATFALIGEGAVR